MFTIPFVAVIVPNSKSLLGLDRQMFVPFASTAFFAFSKIDFVESPTLSVAERLILSPALSVIPLYSSAWMIEPFDSISISVTAVIKLFNNTSLPLTSAKSPALIWELIFMFLPLTDT